jgi:hypothetical protein
LKIKHNSPKKPDNSGTSAQILAVLRANKLLRSPSTVIERHRAAKALASSRMKAKIALDKIEARLASDILDHCRENDNTPEEGVSDYELTGDQAASVLDLVYQMDAAQDLPDGDGRMPQRRQRAGVAL